jgi:hypothetical protein
MGGRNQNTHPLRRGCELVDADAPPLVPTLDSAKAELAAFPGAALLKPPSLADFSAVGVLAAAPKAASIGFPGVLGVLAEPKEANAPDPSPNAVDALGETSPPGVVMGLKGFLPPCEELSPPNRLAKGVRPEGDESF